MKTAILPALVATLCVGTASAAPAAPDKPLVRVGKVTITERQVMQRVLQLLPKVSFHRKLTPSLLARLKKAALAELIEEELLLEEATKRGLVPDDNAVRAERKRLIERAGGEKKFAAQLARVRLSWQDHWLELRRRMAARKVLETVGEGPASVTDDQVKAYYTANRASFKRPPEVRLLRATIAVEAGAPTKAWKQAEQKAEALHRHLGQVKSGSVGKMLAHLAKHDASLSVRDSGWLHKGRLDAALEREAFRLQPGQLSAPIRTLKGYEIIELKDRRPGKQMTYAELEDKLRKKLEGLNNAERRSQLLGRLRAETPVVNMPP